jgi:hypothetical protein
MTVTGKVQKYRLREMPVTSVRDNVQRAWPP